jgi:quercetin 2,3-dioxygenase
MTKITREEIIEYPEQKKVSNDYMYNTSTRSVLHVIRSESTQDGEGVRLNRSFPNNYVSEIDPFLLLDEMGPMDIRPGGQKGFPNHPHRGFETVTYLIEGKFEHEDSHGHAGTISAGDIQWMTAGSGVIHSEMPEKEFSRNGGRLHGFQLWVNLPKGNKMMEPRYQDIPSSKIPTVTTKDGKITVKIIAGESLGAKAVINTITPIMYLHFKLKPDARITQPVPKEFNTFTYVFRGEGLFGQRNNKIVERGNLVVFDNDGKDVYIQSTNASKEPFELLLIGGVPLREPIARYGPFVMNTQQEIVQAIEDYRNGRLG